MPPINYGSMMGLSGGGGFTASPALPGGGMSQQRSQFGGGGNGFTASPAMPPGQQYPSQPQQQTSQSSFSQQPNTAPPQNYGGSNFGGGGGYGSGNGYAGSGIQMGIPGPRIMAGGNSFNPGMTQAIRNPIPQPSQMQQSFQQNQQQAQQQQPQFNNFGSSQRPTNITASQQPSSPQMGIPLPIGGGYSGPQQSQQPSSYGSGPTLNFAQQRQQTQQPSSLGLSGGGSPFGMTAAIGGSNPGYGRGPTAWA